LLERTAVGSLTLTTPEGQQLRFGDNSSPHADLQLAEWSALRRIFRHGDIGLAESYSEGLIETDDLTALIRLGIRNDSALKRALHGNRLAQWGYRLRHLLRANTRQGSSRNIQAHYDLGNEFYALWLDPSMTYSSARFTQGLNGNLACAQSIKYQQMLDYTGANPGDSVLEIGCGWGGFAEYAAKRGIRVHGVTLSPRQLDYARSRIATAGLADSASFSLTDYRDLDGQYDHIVSIEMIEAVGERYWPQFFGKLRHLLKPGGRAAIQSIVIGDQHFDQYRSGTDFIQQYIFPGGLLPSPAALQKLIVEQGFSTRQWDVFGMDYAETLRRWRQSFENRLEEVRAQGFDEQFIRLWRFYLAYCEAGFDETRIDVVQVAFSREQ
jgi:cyclopropane-fatty-acyl-phospholipid synthase